MLRHSLPNRAGLFRVFSPNPRSLQRVEVSPTASGSRHSSNQARLFHASSPRGPSFCPKTRCPRAAITFGKHHHTLANSTMANQNSSSSRKEKVAIIGSGNWGSAIAKVAAKNVKEHSDQFEQDVTMWVFEEDYEGKPLTQHINETHINPKYLPDIPLGDNVYAEPDLEKALKDATALVIVLPHQFLQKTLESMKGKINEDARAVSLIKGIDVKGVKIRAFATLITEELGTPCSSLSGANIATEVAKGHFSESTLGVPTPENFDGDVNELPDAVLWKPLFHSKKFLINVVPDVEGVGLCGALKNIVAVAAGFIDGLGWGSNAKAAIMRVGMNEIKDFCLEYFPNTKPSTFVEESCGIADIITSSERQKHREQNALVDEINKLRRAMVEKGKTFEELEKEMLKGQKLQGPQTALEVHNFIVAKGTKREKGYPLFDAVWRICYQHDKPETVIDNL